jgi:hypothetical protein
VDPQFNGGTERFPLWALSLWKELEKTIQHQILWTSSVRWLGSLTHPKDTITQANSLIKKLPWNEPLDSGGATTLELAGFLGASWLSDTQINMMAKVLRNRMEIEGRTKCALVEPIEFAWELEAVGRGTTDPESSSYLSRLARRVHEGVTAIWFPINVEGFHWIAGRVDFENRTFEFGESGRLRDRIGRAYLRRGLTDCLGYRTFPRGNIERSTKMV